MTNKETNKYKVKVVTTITDIQYVNAETPEMAEKSCTEDYRCGSDSSGVKRVVSAECIGTLSELELNK